MADSSSTLREGHIKEFQIDYRAFQRIVGKCPEKNSILDQLQPNNVRLPSEGNNI